MYLSGTILAYHVQSPEFPSAAKQTIVCMVIDPVLETQKPQEFRPRV